MTQREWLDRLPGTARTRRYIALYRALAALHESIDTINKEIA